ncbi:MAG: DUF4242 domain-containing protein [Sphingomonas sp.]|uniref:nickel-binding protein n=1 Tax=Sphingomonas sp. TaxID=28214 RepID=UPI0017FC640F|nr:nickel-binding protein [Sphingomonas sp.]MBA3667200.1 DUF4242 domain-containing protein [Sphingomonas sp.]
MPLFLDIHRVPGASSEDLRKAHMADLDVQKKHRVDYRKYWFDQKCGKAFCLVEAPDAEAAMAVHRESHGLVAEKIIEIDPDLAEGFLGGGMVNDAGAAMVPGSRDQYDNAVRSVLFTDLVGSTEMAQRMGDQAAFDLLSVHDRIVREAVEASHGKVIKHTGDGIMAVFVSPVSAVKCACRIQEAVRAAQADEATPAFAIRIGASAGEPIERDNDFFGTTVNLAARLCAAAKPGTVLVTNGIAELCLGKGMRFADLKRVTIRGFDEKIGTREVMISC